MTPFQRILFPVDLSEQSQRAAPYVKAMAQRFGAEITALHIMELPATFYAPPEAVAWTTIADVEGYRKEQQARFQDFMKRELCPLRVNAEFLEGEPAYTIASYAAEHKIGLIMMPTHGYGLFRRFLLGSVTAKVLHDSQCPVWTGVHSPELLAHDPLRLRRVLCAIGDDPTDVRLLHWTRNFTRHLSEGSSVVPPAEVMLVHAAPLAQAEGARNTIAKFQEEAGTVFPLSIRSGNPQQVVHAEALAQEADLIVIGRSHHDLGRLHSDDYEIIREAPCPVISI